MPFMQNPVLLPSEDDPKAERARGELADFESQVHGLDREEKDGEALALSQKYVEEQKSKMGPDSIFVGIGEMNVGKFAARSLQWPVAEAALRDALRLKSMYLGDGCLDTVAVLDQLTAVMTNEGKLIEARALADGYWASAQKQPPSLGARIYYLHTLGRLSRAQGRPQEAAAFYREAVSLKRLNPATTMLEPKLMDLLCDSASCDIDLGHYDSALSSLVDYCRQRYDKTRSSDNTVVGLLMQCARDAENKRDLKTAQLAIKNACGMVPNNWVPPQTLQALNTYALRLGVH